MATAVWPGSLPKQLVGVTDSRTANLVRTETDGGPAKVRRRFTAVPRDVQTPMVFTAAQRATFDTFYITTLNDGADKFDWTDPVDNATKTFRFKAPPSFSLFTNVNGKNYRTTLDLELLP